jgi:hypothetical protein
VVAALLMLASSLTVATLANAQPSSDIYDAALRFGGLARGLGLGIWGDAGDLFDFDSLWFGS